MTRGNRSVTARDVAFLSLALVAVSTAAVLIRGAAEAPPLVTAAYRLVLGTLLVVSPALSPARRRDFAAMDRRVFAVAVLSGLLLGGHFATWIASIHMTSVASSLALVTAHPIVVAIGARILFGERVDRRTAGGILVGIGGIVGLALVDRAGAGGTHAASRALAGDALAFAGCLLVAGYLLSGRWARDRSPLWPYLVTTYATAALLLVGLVAALGRPVTGFSPNTYLFFVLLALIPQGVGHTLVNRSLRVFPTVTVSIAILAEVPLATLLAFWLLGEIVPPERMLAVGVVASGVVLAVLGGRRNALAPRGALWQEEKREASPEARPSSPA